MTNIIERLEKELHITESAKKFLANYTGADVFVDAPLVVEMIESKVTRKYDAFTKVYAHSKCAVFADGLYDLLTSTDMSEHVSGVEIVALNQGDEAIHYCCQTVINDTKYYIDAYGSYSDINDIIARYKDHVVSDIAIIKFDTDEHEIFRELTVEVIDYFDTDSVKNSPYHFTEVYVDFVVDLAFRNMIFLSKMTPETTSFTDIEEKLW